MNNHIFLRRISAWEVVSALLDQVERADVLTICSFAMSEGFARRLLLERKRISRLILILDMTIASRHRGTLLFLHQVADEIYLCNNHSKAILLESGTHHAAAVMSANATMNFRYECGYITTHTPVVIELAKELEKLKKNATRSKTDRRICLTIPDD